MTQDGARTVVPSIRQAGWQVATTSRRLLQQIEQGQTGRGRRERFIVDADAAHEISGINRVSNGNRLKIRAECGEVAASVYQSVGNAEATQGVQRAIDGEALGDTPEIDPDLSIGKTHHVIGQQFDLVRVPRLSGAPWLVDRSRKPSKTLQDWRDGNVERTSRSGIQVDRRAVHLIAIIDDGRLRGIAEPVTSLFGQKNSLADGPSRQHRTQHRCPHSNRSCARLTQI
jgi:hypothetical protein